MSVAIDLQVRVGVIHPLPSNEIKKELVCACLPVRVHDIGFLPAPSGRSVLRSFMKREGCVLICNTTTPVAWKLVYLLTDNLSAHVHFEHTMNIGETK